MTTALATTTNNLPSHTHLGDRNEIAAVRSRLASMMQLPADVPDDVIWAAAQLAVAHRLNPFTGEIYIIELGAKKNDATGTWVKQYRAHVGVKGLRTIARRQANFTMKMAVMNPDEVQRYRRDLYHPDDIGVRCTLWRLDVARECKDAGVPYEPVIGVGFWRHQSQQRRGEWVADNIPNTWTAQQVAEKRAEINAIKLAYDLALDIADPGATGEEDVINVIGHQMDAHDADTALPLPRQLQVEDDGDILFDVEPPRRTVDAATGEILPAPTPAPRSAPENGISADVDLGMGESSDNPFDGDTPWYAAARAKLTNGVAKFCDAALGYHRDGGPASAKQYGYLSGLLDSIVEQATGAEDAHRRVLTVLCQTEITDTNPPSATLASKLLDKLATHKMVNGSKVENGAYDQAIADAVVAIYRAAEAVGTPTLLAA